MLGAGRINIKLALIAVGAFFIGAAATAYGGVAVLLRLFLPSLYGETRQIITIASVLLIVAIIVIAFNTEGFRNLF